MKLRNLFYVLLLFVSVNTLITAQVWTDNLPPKNESDLTFYDYQNAFNEYWSQYNVVNGYIVEPNGDKRKAAGWKQFKRWENYWEPRVDKNTGSFPEISLEDAMSNYYNPPQGLTMGLGVANWTSLGPNASGGGYAGVGRINCIAFHPSDNNTFWVGAASGGIWKTTDGGSSWTVLNNGTGVLAVSDIIIPSDYATSNTIYIATGDRDGWNNNSIGVLKSTDGGVTWNTTDLTYPVANSKMVSRLLVDPANDQTIIAATRDGVYKTTNGGTNWNTQLTTERFLDIEYKPGDFSTLYGGTKYDGEVWRSTDGGATWSMPLNTTGSRVEIAVSADDPTLVYALSANSGLVGVYKSTDSGATFTLVYDGAASCQNLLGWNSDGCDSGGQGWYDLSLEANPSDANMIFVGGVNTWKSTDGGATFSINNHWYGAGGVPAVHADKHKLRYRSNGDLFECNDGGVYITTDNGSTWVDKTNGMVISQMYKIGVSQTVATETQCGLQDNGTKLITGGVWSDVRGGDGMECIIDYTDVNTQYNTYVNGDIDRTTDHWSNSTSIKPSGASGAWVTPYIIDPVDHNTLYAGYQNIYKSTDQGSNWSIIYNLNSGDKFRAMAIAPSNTQVLYASEPYVLWKTVDGGTNWTDITSGLPGDFITYIAVKNDDPNTVWVTLSTYSGNSVYESTNGGTSWTSISAGLPSVPVNCIVQNKLITGQNDLYVGTDNGVYYKAGAANWASFNTGLPNVDMAELEIYYDLTTPENSILRGGSYGRGLWESPIIAACAVTITQSDEGTCNDNGTDADPDDDWFSITFNASAISGGVSNKYEVVLNANTDGTGGTVLNPGGTTYGTSVTVGDATTPPFVADGATTYVITVRDFDDNTCHSNYTSEEVTSCSNAVSVEPCSQLFISEYGEPNGGNGKYVEIYNPTNVAIDLSNYKLWRISNGGSWPEAILTLSGSLDAYNVYIAANNSGDVPGADIYNSGFCSWNGDDAVGLAYNGGSGSTFNLIDAIGEDGSDPGSGWNVAGTTNATKNHTLVRKATVDVPNTDWDASRGTNTSDSEWEVQTYGQSDLGSHTSDCYVLPVCALTITQSDEGTCNDNGTDNDASDDWFDITFDASSTNGGATDKYEVVLNANSDGTGGTVLNTGGTTYGTSVTVGTSTTPPFKADGSTTYNITVRDVDDPTCHADYITSTVASCSVPPPCAVTIDQSDEGTCNNNGTDNDASDDWFDITFNATSTNGGATDKYEVVLNANTDGTGGTVLNTGGTTYGTAVTVGTSTTPPFKADGSSIYAITVRDIDENTCHADYITSTVASCSTGSITIDNSGGPTIADPCTCAGNGEFDEEVVVHSGTGEVWVLSVNTGYLDPATMTEFPIGTAFVENPAGSGQYTLVGKHLDDEGYNISVEGGPGGNTPITLSISNECWYPIAQIDNLPGTVCPTASPITLAGSAQLGDNAGSATAQMETWAGPGVTGGVFTPAVAGIGLHTITYTFDAMDDDPTEHHPGCSDVVNQQVFVGDVTPPMFDMQLACETISCGNAMPTNLPTATDNCDATVTVTEEAVENITDYTCAGEFLVFGTQDQPFIPYGLYGHAPLAPQFTLDLNNVNGIGAYCDSQTGKHIYGMWQDPTDRPSLTNSPDVYFVDVNPYTGKTAVMGTIAAPALLTAGANETAISYALNGIGDVGGDDFYMAGIAMLVDNTTNDVTDFKLYKGTIGLSICPPMGNPVSVVYEEINLDQVCGGLLANFINDLSAFLNGTGGEPSGGIQDWAVSPDGLTLYAFMGVENAMMSIDIATSAAVCIPAATSNVVNGYVGSTGAVTDEFSGMYYDDADVLHGFQSDRGRIFSIDIATGELTLVDDSLPIDQRGDAASCTDCSISTIACPEISRAKRVFKVEDAFGNVNYQYQLVTTIDVIPPMFDMQLACDTVSCGDAMPTDIPTATDNCGGTVTVTEEPTEDISDYTCNGDFLVFGMQDQPFLPYGLYGHAPFAPQFVLDLNNINGIGSHCTEQSGKHIYGMWQDPIDKPSLTNSPDVYFVEINPYSGKTAVMGTIAAPALLTPGANETAISYALNGIGDVGGDDFYMAGIAMLFDNTTNDVTDFKLYKGTIGITNCPPMGGTIPVVYDEIDLDAVCSVLLANFVNSLSDFLKGTGGEPSGGIQDWAVSPDGLTLYAFMGIENAMMSIDIATSAAACTPSDPNNNTNGYTGTAGAVTDEFAGMYFDNGGVLHGFQSDRGRIYSIDIITGTLTLIDDTLPTDQRGDAASCFDCDASAIACPMVAKTKRVFKAIDACGNVNYQYQLVYEIDDTDVSLNDPADECENGNDMLFTGIPTDANGVFTTNAPAGFTDNGNGTAVLDVSVAGDGTYKVFYTYNKNGACCPKTDSVEVTVLETPDEPIVDDITVCEGESTLIVPQSTGGPGGGGACLATEDLVISGVIDGPLSGGVPKAIEFYVVNDITDLSAYGFGSANNGGGTDGEEFTFPADAVTAGTYIWVASNVAGFNDFFGFNPTYTSGAASINGDDAIELFHNGGVIDVFGDINTDGTGEPWEYMDGWAYRVMDTGEDGTTFVLANWTFSGPNALDGETDNATAATPFPISTYTCSLGINPPLFNFYSDAGLTNLLAGPVASYDPMTTVTNSPQSIWVTELNSDTGCESDPVEVVITVYAQPEADAGDNLMFCGIPASVSISATANYTGIWTTSGAGLISNPTSPSTTYIPADPGDLATTVVMTWTTNAPAGVGCISAIDTMGITMVPSTEDAEFSYPEDEYCPDGGNPTVTHITGVDGIYTYEVVSDGPNLVFVDKHTGEIDMAASDFGTYDVTNTVDGRGNLIITGVIDGPITGGLPKAIEVYALQDITDLSRYGLEIVSNNNNSTGNPSFNFPDDAVTAGTYIWISKDAVEFNNFFGSDPTYTSSVANGNGNDAFLLYNDGQVIDVFGEVGMNNNINDWNYQDGWAYRIDNTGPDGTVFKVDNWSFSGPNALDGETLNATAAVPFPMASFTTNYQGTCDANTHTDRVVVGDLISPVIDCPQDWNVYLDPGDCSIFFHYDYPEASDNCDLDPIVTLISGPDTGDEFTLLNSPYTMEFKATDIYGNESDVCTFEIAIHGYPNAVEGVLACNDEIQVSLDDNCEIQMNADNFLEGGPYQCYNMFQVYVNDPSQEGINVSNQHIHLDPGTYMVTVADEAAIGNSCMTLMTVVDKIGPVIECNCPAGSTDPECVIAGCYDPEGSYVFALPTVSDNCEEPELRLISKEVVDNGVCGSETVVLTWEASDESGNTATCTEEYIFQGADITLLTYPKNYDDLPFNEPMLECSEDWYLYDNQGNRYDYPHPDQTGYPTGFGEFCSTVEIFYTDDVKNLDCGKKILRKWAVVDDCTGLVYSHTQVIRITDKIAPTFMEMEGILTNTKGYICNSDVEVPTIMHLEDNCYAAPQWWVSTDMGFDISGDINGNGFVDINETWTVLDVPIGTYEMCYHAIDNCGNEATQCMTITVMDMNPPVPVCEQYKQVSITAMGNGRVLAEDFDSGSFDNCNPVYFKALRVDSNLVYDGGCEGLNGDDNPFTSPIDVWYDKDVYFCCEDVDSDVMVSMRVFEVDPGVGSVNPKRMEIGGDLYGHFNDCWSIVHVECKIPPALDCPPVTVTCEESLDPVENPRLMPNIISVCGFDTSYTDKRDLGICGAKIIRTWTATGCEKATQCKQTITIESTEPFDPCTIKFPKDEKADCSASLPYDKEPTWDEYPCNVVTAEVIHEDTFRFVDGACYKIAREWAVVDWCVYEENTGAEDNVDVISGTKLNCAQLVNDGYYRYTQILMVTDFIPPTIEVEDACIAYTDGCYANGTTLTASATDSCNVDQKFNWKYLVVNMDTWDTIQYSYNYTPKPQTGKAGKRSKDDLDRTAEASLEILESLPGGTYRVQWTVGDGCGNANTALQYFEVRDKKAPTPVMVDIATALMTNCMVEVCAITFDKGGCEGSCISSYDNCTEKSDLYFTFSPVIPQLDVNPLKWQNQFAKYGRYFYDPVTGLISTEAKYFFGQAFAWDPDRKTSCRIYGLDEDGNAPDLTQRVEVYVWDKFAMNETCDDNNYDFAYVILALNNEGDDCPVVGSLVSGMVSDCSADIPISGVDISFDNGEDVKHSLNYENGTYQTSLEDNEYTVTASKQTEGLNGITTLDIVLIQKHILGIKKIDDVCSYAAMDANSDGRVSASDILTIRKMILGSSEQIVNWNFMDEEYLENYPDVSYFSLKDAYTKTITMSNGSTMNNTNFEGVYSGDVNNSGDHIERRSDNSIELVVDDVIFEEGEVVEIPVFAREFANIYGAQFSMNISGLELSEIIPGAIVLSPNNYNVVNNNFVMSWDSPSKVSIDEDEILFTLVVKANIDGQLSDILTVNDDVARAEAYIGSDLEISELTLKVRNSNYEYTLYQNEPNPFSEKTIIGFDLPIENEYTLSIFDITGKLIKEFTELGKTGYNSITLDKNEVGLSGVLYYQLKSGDYTNTKKMIILK